MATDFVVNINGSLVADPKIKATTANGDAIWNFAMAVNHKDSCTTWINFTFFASPNFDILVKAKKGTTLRVAAELPWVLNEYTFGAFNPEKNSANIQLQAFGVKRGSFDSKKEEKPEGEKDSDLPKGDGLVPVADPKDREFIPF